MLCDFGLARIINEEVRTGLTTTTKHSATLLYAAPEILSASEDAPFEPSTASDIYSLGSLLYQVSVPKFLNINSFNVIYSFLLEKDPMKNYRAVRRSSVL